MIQEKVTRKELREMRVGQTRIFKLTSENKVASARVTTARMKREEDIAFDVKTDFRENCICITRKK